MGGGGSGELLLLSFIGSWRGLADGGSGSGERGRDFMVESGKETGGLTGLEGTGAAGAGAGAGVVIAGGRGLGGLTGLAELRAKTDSDLVLLLLAVALVLVLFEVERGSGTVVLMGLWLLVSRGAGTGGIGGETDFAGGGGSGGEGRTDFAGGGGGGDFDGLGERAGGGGGGGLAGLGGVCVRCLCGLGSLDPSGLFRAIEVADPWALALTLALTVGLEGATETGPYATRAGRGGGGKFGLTAIWWGGDGSGPALGTGGIERETL